MFQHNGQSNISHGLHLWHQISRHGAQSLSSQSCTVPSSMTSVGNGRGVNRQIATVTASVAFVKVMGGMNNLLDPLESARSYAWWAKQLQRGIWPS